MRILSLFKPFKRKIAIITACIFASSGISMILPLISKDIMDKGLLGRNFKTVILLSAASLSLLLLDQGIGLLETKHRSYVNAMMSYNLTKTAFKHTLRLKLQYFNNTNFAEIMNNINMDVGNLSRISDRSSYFIVSSIFKIMGGIIGLLLIDWRLTVLVVIIMPVRYILVKFLARKRQQLFEKLMDCSRDYYGWYGDIIGGIKEIKLWGLDRVNTGLFINKQRKLININIKLAFIDKINEFSESFLFETITNMLYVIGAYMIFHDSFTIGGLFAFITYSMYVTAPISAILNIGYNFSNIIPSAKRLFEFLDMECEDGRKGIRVSEGDTEEIKGSIVFDNVSFSYKHGEPVLQNVSFEIKEGEKVAVIGANGSGKTTLINLLLRFYRPDSGNIILDGVNIAELSLKDFRHMISVVSQDLYLFNGTIEENIAMHSKKDRELKIRKASVDSGANEFIEEFPDKYKCEVGRNGAKLSGGQRQKIAMARAFARDSKILVLDEATSNYDVESELHLNAMLGKNLENRTVIVISHRPYILNNVDKIIILENGTVREVIKGDEYRKNGLYHKMIDDIYASDKRVVI